MQQGSNKAERRRYPIWFGWYSYGENEDDKETRRKKIRRCQRLECIEELNEYRDSIS